MIILIRINAGNFHTFSLSKYQGYKGIRQWTINWEGHPSWRKTKLLVDKINRSVEESFGLKSFDTANLNLTKIKDNLLSQQIRKHSKKTGASVTFLPAKYWIELHTYFYLIISN